MAIAIPAPVVADRTRSQVSAAVWTTASALFAFVATIPLVVMLAGPISDLVFVRGSEYYNDWGRAFSITLIIVAPATYTLFMGIAGELLKNRVSARVHRTTMRVAAVGMIPFVVMMVAANFWSTGPQESLMISAGLTIPIGIVATIWASTQNH